jgi:chromosome segregation ATPase
MKECDDAKETIKALQGEKEELNKEIKALNQDKKALNSEIGDLKSLNEKLSKLLEEAMESLKKDNKHMASEESKTIKESISKYVKVTGYRRWKFINPKNKDAFLEEIYDYVAKKHDLNDKDSEDHLPLDEFKRIYSKTSFKCLGEKRQYSQSQMLLALQGE